MRPTDVFEVVGVCLVQFIGVAAGAVPNRLICTLGHIAMAGRGISAAHAEG